MGKGDRKTRKGKIRSGSFGRYRMRKSKLSKPLTENTPQKEKPGKKTAPGKKKNTEVEAQEVENTVVEQTQSSEETKGENE